MMMDEPWRQAGEFTPSQMGRNERGARRYFTTLTCQHAEGTKFASGLPSPLSAHQETQDDPECRCICKNTCNTGRHTCCNSQHGSFTRHRPRTGTITCSSIRHLFMRSHGGLRSATHTVRSVLRHEGLAALAAPKRPPRLAARPFKRPRGCAHSPSSNASTGWRLRGSCRQA